MQDTGVITLSMITICLKCRLNKRNLTIKLFSITIIILIPVFDSWGFY